MIKSAVILKYFYILVAIILMAVGYNLFLGPHNIAAGGITGLAIIIENIIEIDRASVVAIGNLCMVALSYFFLGREVFFNTILGALTLPIAVNFVPRTMLVQDASLSMVIGATIIGVSVHMLYSNNASTGGTAVPPLIFKKYFGLNPSLGILFTDGVIVILSLWVFTVDAFFFAIVSIALTSFVMSYLENGINRKKMVYIISDKSEEIAAQILKNIGRGVTIAPVIGGHSKQPRSMLLAAMDRREYRALLQIVNAIDRRAFMVTSSVTDVLGEGFTFPPAPDSTSHIESNKNKNEDKLE